MAEWARAIKCYFSERSNPSALGMDARRREKQDEENLLEEASQMRQRMVKKR